MIQEMRDEYKEKISREDQVYRICWKLHDNIIDMFRRERAISKDFMAYLVQLEEEKKKQYRGHYDWGRAMERGTILDDRPGDEAAEEKRRTAERRRSVGRIIKCYSESMFML